MNISELYNKICGFSPTTEQIDTFTLLSDWVTSKNPLVVRLPCGYGKTEAVVIPYLSQALTKKWTLAPRLIYVLPTRALCNQIALRIGEYAGKVEQAGGNKISVKVEHGVSSLDPLFFADMCVTTFDQFLYGYARSKSQVGRHLDLPAGSIANSVVVFDEAHLYSPYTHSLMRAMIEILVASRIPCIAMTATMPYSLRNDLFGSKEPEIDFNGQWPDFIAERSIRWTQEDWPLIKNDKLTAELEQLLKTYKGKKILIVTNRIDTAQKVANALKKRDDFITLIHSRFTVADREHKEDIVCKSFGKKKENQKSGIIVSTQVCEVGLDISCDVLITECPSADSLIQRAGRVARWGGKGNIIVVKPEHDDVEDFLWNKAYPYVDPKHEEMSEFDGLRIGEYSGITWEYLKKEGVPKDIFTNWRALTSFCNSMNYHTDDVEARGALGQLFESTLYADERPWNLSARGDLYCTLAVVSDEAMTFGDASETPTRKPSKSKRGKTHTLQMTYEELRQCFINVPFRYLVNKDTKKLKPYEFMDGKAGEELGKTRIKPFQTYIIDSSGHYDADIGLTISQKEKADETEEAASCLIL